MATPDKMTDSSIPTPAFPVVEGVKSVAQIGAGATGLVWKAKATVHDKANVQVTAKCIQPDKRTDEKVLELFDRECSLLERATREISHPVIAEWYDTKTANDQSTKVLLYEFVDGNPLLEWIKEQDTEERLSWKEILWLLWPLAHALRALHSHRPRIAHLDLSGKNILVPSSYERQTDKKVFPFVELEKALERRGQEGQDDEQPHSFIRLIDFGLATESEWLHADARNHQSMIFGTRGFQAPEFAKIHRYESPKATPGDIFSFGAILYYCLVGSYTERRDGEVVKNSRRIRCKPISYDRELRESRPEIPAALVELVNRCLEFTPSRRPTASELVEHIQTVVRLEDNDTRRSLPNVPVVRRVRAILSENLVQTLFTLVAGIAVVLSILLLNVWMHSSEMSEKNAELEKKNREVTLSETNARENAELAKQESLTARQLLHANRMVMAQQSLESGLTQRAIEQLEACFVGPGQTDLRGFEWRCLWQLAHSERTAFQGHDGIVNSIAFSPDGTRLGSSSWDSTVRIWNSTNGLEELRIDTNNQRPYFAWSPDGTRVAAGLNRLGIWTTDTGSLVRRFPETPSLSLVCLSYSPDGSLLAAGQRDETGGNTHPITLYDTENGVIVGQMLGHSGAVRCLVFSMDGETLISGGEDSSMIVWSVPTRTKLLSLSGHTGVVSGLAFSPDGKSLASVGWDGTLRLWDPNTWQSTSSFQVGSGILRAVSFMADNKTIVSGGGDREIVFYDSLAGKKDVGRSLFHPDMIWSISVSADGTRIASSGGQPRIAGDGSAGGAGGIIQVSDTATGQKYKPVRLWAERASQQLRASTWTNSLVVLEKEHSLVTGLEDGSLQAWKWVTDHYESSTHTSAHTGPVRAVVEIRNKNRIASAGVDGEIQVRHTDDLATPLTAQKHGAQILAFACSKDGRHLVSSGTDHRLVLWKSENLEKLWVIDIGAELVECLAVSPDGNWIATGDRTGVVVLRSIATGKIHQTFQPHHGAVTALMFSPNGLRILSSSSDRTACVHTLGSESKALLLRGHTDEIHGVAFTNDGRRAVTGSWDRSVKVWDLATGLELLTLRGATHPIGAVAFRSDDLLLVSVQEYPGIRRGLVMTWKAADPPEIWKHVVERHSLNVTDEMTMVRCAWTLGTSYPETEMPPLCINLLQQGQHALEKRLSRTPDDKQAAIWMSEFGSRLHSLSDTAYSGEKPE